jgi:hypothetical protein
MKRVIVLVALVAGLLAIPTAASANHNPPAGVLGGTITSVGGSFTVEILEGHAGHTSKIWLDAPDEIEIGIADNGGTNMTAGPVAGTFGPFDAGDELVFRIDVVQNSESWFTGPGGAGSRNDDLTAHAYVNENGPGDWTVWFEDLNVNDGNYDGDYEDAVFRVVQTCNPENEGECTTEDNEGNTATVACEDEPCPALVLTPSENPGGANAAFNVVPVKENGGTFLLSMVVTMASRDDSTPPGTATVQISIDGGGFETMERCTQTDDENCIVSITSVRGGLTQYTLQFNVDPNFRFR